MDEKATLVSNLSREFFFQTREIFSLVTDATAKCILPIRMIKGTDWHNEKQDKQNIYVDLTSKTKILSPGLNF